jgi:peptidoglycan/LPS O-acetylase OafA/YrhL
MKQQIDALTGTRAIAALLVVVFHYGCTFLPFSYAEHFFRNGNLAVSYFFILSGFVMYYTYGGREVDYKTYMRNRLARIAPLYWFALAITIALSVYNIVVYKKWPWDELIEDSIYQFLFIQAYLPGHALTLNGPGWSLSVEMFFYLLFPLLLKFANKNIRWFLWFTLALFVATQVWHIGSMMQYQPSDGEKLREALNYGPWGHLSEFACGMAAGWYYRRLQQKQERPGLYPFIVFIILVLTINYMPPNISMHNGLLAPLILLLIIGIAFRGPVFLRSRPMVYLGEISYGIYILQVPVHNYSMMLNNGVLHINATAAFYGYLLVLLLLSSACYHIIEKPLRKAIARK